MTVFAAVFMDKKNRKTMAFQEPCCIANKLPSLLRRKWWYAFQTNGDVTVDKFMSALSSMAGRDNNHLLLVIGKIDVPLLRVIRHYFDMGWLRSCNILTYYDDDKLIETELTPYLDKITFGHHSRVFGGLIMFQGEEGTVVLSGMLNDLPQNLILPYTACYSECDPDIARDFCEPYESLLRIVNEEKRKKDEQSD